MCTVFFQRILHCEHLVPLSSLPLANTHGIQFNLQMVSRASSRKSCKLISHPSFSFSDEAIPSSSYYSHVTLIPPVRRKISEKNIYNIGVCYLKYLASQAVLKENRKERSPEKGKVRQRCHVAWGKEIFSVVLGRGAVSLTGIHTAGSWYTFRNANSF